jgi:hypothetical protein
MRFSGRTQEAERRSCRKVAVLRGQATNAGVLVVKRGADERASIVGYLPPAGSGISECFLKRRELDYSKYAEVTFVQDR